MMLRWTWTAVVFVAAVMGAAFVQATFQFGEALYLLLMLAVGVLVSLTNRELFWAASPKSSSGRQPHDDQG